MALNQFVASLLEKITNRTCKTSRRNQTNQEELTCTSEESVCVGGGSAVENF